jgi:hypothetical protein
MYEHVASTLARTAALFIHAVTASISRTHSQCQRRGTWPLPRRTADPVFFIPGTEQRSHAGGMASSGSIAR